MASNKFRLDRKGVAAYLKNECADVVNSGVEKVAANVRAMVDSDVEVEVDYYTTDRGAGAVTIADARGLELQAKGGVLTRAAAGAGMEVTSR